jgi:hypothetical protein
VIAHQHHLGLGLCSQGDYPGQVGAGDHGRLVDHHHLDPVQSPSPAERFGTALSLLVDLVFGDDVQQAELSMRLDAFLDQLGANPLTAAQQRIVAAVNLRIEALVRHSFEGLGRW